MTKPGEGSMAKFALPETPEAELLQATSAIRKALRKEFETGYRLEHPNLVRYISLTDDGILMEYVDGETLSQRIAAHPEYFTKQNTDKFLHQAVGCRGLSAQPSGAPPRPETR